MGMVEALSQGEECSALRLSEVLANAVASGMIGLSIWELGSLVTNAEAPLSPKGGRITRFSFAVKQNSG